MDVSTTMTAPGAVIEDEEVELEVEPEEGV